MKFDNGIVTELTATPRTGMARFAFPAQAAPTLLIRANGAVAVRGNEVSGRADWKPGRPKVYFAAQFEQPIKSVSTWNGDKISGDAAAEGAACGAILTFDATAASPVQVRVGISYVSLENARENLARENTGWDFAAVRQQAVAAWNEQLGKIEVEGGTPAARTVFYTAMYHCFMHPNLLDDVNGEYPGMDEKIHHAAPGHHQYQNIPAWDQHRSHTAWMAVVSPRECSDVMQSLVNYAEQDASVRHDGGGLPRWEQVNTNSGGMVGDGDDTMLATAYAFGARDFNVKGALAAMDKGASQPGTTSDGHKVRGGLEEYDRLGYVPDSPAVTLEYCADDFSLAQFAGNLGDREKQARYLARARNWTKLFEPTAGYLVPRLADGTWMQNFSPSTLHGFIEGSAAQYLWMVNFDLPGLIERLGGNAKTVERLDKFFTKTNAGMRSEFAYMGNEPCEAAPWIYDFAGAPWRTQDVVRRIQNELFTDRPDGLPGNDDAGSLSSWYVFSALGLYPEIPGAAGFAVGSPVFPKATLHLENGKTLQIVARAAAPDCPYVQSLRINGAPHESPWISWQMLSQGGVLDFDLGMKQTTWGSDPKMVPPSFATAPSSHETLP